jgi:hypothetical protein
MDWKKAEQYLKKMRLRYTEDGIGGLLALSTVMNPLLIRFENGERTEELYNKIMSIE